MERIDPAAAVLQLHASIQPHYLRLFLWWRLRSHKVGAGGGDSTPLLAQPHAQCSRLVQLTLSTLGLVAVPGSLASSGVIPGLQKLDLSLNSLTSLATSGRGGSSSWLCGLPGLTELNIASNQIATLPPELGELAALKTLRAGANELHALPSELGELGELRELYLHSNALSAPALDPVLVRLSQLEVLDVNHNLLSSLPSSILRCVRLLKVNADNNRLVSLLSGGEGGGWDGPTAPVGESGADATEAAAAFGSLTRLQRLYLANNELRGAVRLAGALASTLPALRVCDLSCNYGDVADAAGDARHEGPIDRSVEPAARDGNVCSQCDLVVAPLLTYPGERTAAAWSGGKPRLPLPGDGWPLPATAPKHFRNLVAKGQFLDGLALLCDVFFRPTVSRYRIHFAVEPVLRRRGLQGEAHLAALTSPRAPANSHADYTVTFKADTLLRTSYPGIVRQLGHELQHVEQFSKGIFDFARQEFLAYGWMITNADDRTRQMQGSGDKSDPDEEAVSQAAKESHPLQGETRPVGDDDDDATLDIEVTHNKTDATGRECATEQGRREQEGHARLPPLSKEEILAIAGHVNEFWRLLPMAHRVNPSHLAIYESAESLRRVLGSEGQISIHMGVLLGKIPPGDAAKAARTIQRGWRRHASGSTCGKRVAGDDLSMKMCSCTGGVFTCFRRGETTYFD